MLVMSLPWLQCGIFGHLDGMIYSIYLDEKWKSCVRQLEIIAQWILKKWSFPLTKRGMTAAGLFLRTIFKGDSPTNLFRIMVMVAAHDKTNNQKGKKNVDSRYI